MFRRCWTSTPTGPCARVVSRLDRDGRLPIGELVALSEASAIGVTIDRWTVPTVVIVYPRRSALFDLLSPREREVAELIAAGFRNAEIAERLYISVATVKDYLHGVLTKTKLGGRSAVIAAWHGRRAG